MINLLRIRRWTAFGFVAFALGACGSSSQTGGPGDAGSNGGGGQDAAGLEGGSPLANGTCSFVLDNTTYSLPGYGAMDGSGNLMIECATSEISLELGVGNGTYTGPGEYTFAPNKSDGSLTITTADVVYDATWPGNVQTACIVDVAVGAASSFPPKGSAVQGTLRCTALPQLPIQPNGSHADQPSGYFDLTQGAFAVEIR